MNKLINRMKNYLVTCLYPNFTLGNSYGVGTTHVIVTRPLTGISMFTINISNKSVYVEPTMKHYNVKELAYLIKWAKQENYSVVSY